MRYKYILIDADGTVFDYEKAEKESLENTFKTFCIDTGGADYFRLYAEINSMCWQEFEAGKITLEELRIKRFINLIKEGGFGCIDPGKMGRTYLEFLSLSGNLLEGAPELLEKLSERHSVSMITNGIAEIQYSRIKVSGIGKYFQHIIISDEIGHQKPSGQFFGITMDRIGNPPLSEVIVIGDSLSSDIKGGNSYGIDTCWLNLSGKDISSEESAPDTVPKYEVSCLSDIIDIVS